MCVARPNGTHAIGGLEMTTEALDWASREWRTDNFKFKATRSCSVTTTEAYPLHFQPSVH